MDPKQILEICNRAPSERSDFTRFVSGQIYAKGFNVIVCHSQFTHEKRTKFTYAHYELKTSWIGTTCGFDIYTMNKGDVNWFIRWGPGGYENWSYAGDVVVEQSNPVKVKFQ